MYKIGLLNNLVCRGNVHVVQKLNLQGQGKINLDEDCMLGVYPSPQLFTGECYLEARSSAANIYIGKRVHINNNAVIIADKSSITIGDDSMIGPNFICFDSNFHSLHPDKRMSSDYSCKPVIIGRNVFIGANVTILQGVTIVDNSVICAGAVIDKCIPPNIIAKASRDIDFIYLNIDAYNP